MYWMISANSTIYDHLRSFEDFGYIDWRQGSFKYAVGNVVYIYATRPDKKIRHKCVVKKIDMKISETRDDRDYWKNDDEYQKNLDGKFFRLAIVESCNNEDLGLSCLQENGLISAPQGAKKLDGKLLFYINSKFSSSLLLTDIRAKENDEINNSMSLDQAKRLKKIKKSNSKPRQIEVTSYVYSRNPDVVAEALFRASGKCEDCNNDAPFMRKSDNSPYLEVHHVTPLSEGGEDSIKNVIALCPNCHRKNHYGI